MLPSKLHCPCTCACLTLATEKKRKRRGSNHKHWLVFQYRVPCSLSVGGQIKIISMFDIHCLSGFQSIIAANSSHTLWLNISLIATLSSCVVKCLSAANCKRLFENISVRSCPNIARWKYHHQVFSPQSNPHQRRRLMSPQLADHQSPYQYRRAPSTLYFQLSVNRQHALVLPIL